MAERAKAKKGAAKKAPKGAQASRGKVAKTEKKPRDGHNSGKVSAALIRDHHEKIGEIEVRLAKKKAEYDGIKGQLRAAYAVVKQDGIAVDDFKLARELDKRDHGSVITGYANTGDYLAAMKSPLSTQMDLFANMTVPAPANASLAGAHAFGNEEPRSNNPHRTGSEEFVAWDSAWMAAADQTPLTDGEGKTIN